MGNRRLIGSVALGLLLGLTTLATAQPMRGGEGVLSRFFATVKKLPPNAQQLAEIEAIESDLSAKLQAAEGGAGPDRADTVRDLAVQARLKALDVLEPEQRKALQRALSAARDPTQRPSAPDASPTLPAAGDGPAVGEPAPDLTLAGVGGPDVRLSQLRGRVVVLVWGSLSSAVFREKSADLAPLVKSAGPGVAFYIVYGPEAHPKGTWDVERNQVADIAVPEPPDLEARKAAAADLRGRFAPSLSVVADDMAQTATRALGGGENAAVVIDRDGNIAWRQRWFDADGLERHIRAAVARPRSKAPSP